MEKRRDPNVEEFNIQTVPVIIANRPGYLDLGTYSVKTRKG